MSFFHELNARSLQESRRRQFFHQRQMREAEGDSFDPVEYNNTISNSRKNRKAEEEEHPFLDLIFKVIEDLSAEGFTFKKDGVSWRRLGWEISNPKWPEGCCIYLNWYSPKMGYNSNARGESGEWAQAWPRWFDEKGIPKLGKKTKLPYTGFDAALRNLIRDFVIFQETHLQK